MSRVLTPFEADRRFFERFTGRTHRIRVAARAEAAFARKGGLLTMDPPDGFRPYVGVRAEGFGRFHYAIGHLRADADADMAESDACDCFDLLLKQGDTRRADSPHQHQPEPLPRPLRNNVA